MYIDGVKMKLTPKLKIPSPKHKAFPNKVVIIHVEKILEKSSPTYFKLILNAFHTLFVSPTITPSQIDEKVFLSDIRKVNAKIANAGKNSDNLNPPPNKIKAQIPKMIISIGRSKTIDSNE